MYVNKKIICPLLYLTSRAYVIPANAGIQILDALWSLSLIYSRDRH